jgi:MFS family permease
MSSTSPRAANNLRPASVALPSGAALSAWRNALFVIFALCGIGLASWAARIPAVSVALQLDTAQLGVLLFGIAVGSIAGLIASGHLVATFGAKRVILITLLIAPLGLVLAALGVTVFDSFAVAALGLVVFGAATGICDVAMNVSGAANERAIGKTIMPIYHAFFSAGTIVGAALGALAEALKLPLAIHLGILGVLIVVVVIWVVRYLLPEGGGTDHAVTPDGTDGWRKRLAIWRDPRTLLIGLVVLGMAFTEGSANDWLSYAMVHGHDTDATVGALVFGVFVTAMTVGRLSGVRLLDRYGRVPVLRASAALAAIGLLMLIFVPIVWVAVIGVIFWGLGASLGFPVGMSAAADDPRKAAARVSAVATIGYVAFLVGPPVIGFLGNHFGILHGLLLVLVLVALAGVVSFAAREPANAAHGGAVTSKE